MHPCRVGGLARYKWNPGKRAGKQAAFWRQAEKRAPKSQPLRFLVAVALLLYSAAGPEKKGSREAAAMEIRVRCGCGEPSCLEWAVVELQGVVQPQASFAGDIRGLHIGRLCSAPSPSASKGGYTFTVGYHELAGTKVALKKPLLVLRKKKVTSGGAGDQESLAAAAEVEQELEVIGVIRHKILFKDRPKALISKPVTKEKKTVQPAPCQQFRGP
ncbi:unnamed protein product [Urochloa humidicola]